MELELPAQLMVGFTNIVIVIAMFLNLRLVHGASRKLGRIGDASS